MLIHQYHLRVRYGDTDQMGYVYYANYGYYYEQARAETIRSVGISYKEIEASGIIMPITRMNVRYIQPAVYDELLTIKTYVPHLPNRIMVFNYEIYNEAQALINEGETHLAFVDSVSRKIKSAPPILLEKLKAYYK
jgi:acyl-CoA thioester hydrolase